MAVLPIRITGDDILHSPAKPVIDFDRELTRLIDDMVETMAEAPGVGLAAPQVGVPLRVFVWNWTDDNGGHHSGVAINPELWVAPVGIEEPDDDTDEEGCLSIPGERFALRRSGAAMLRGRDHLGAPLEITAQGWLARIFQHEYDHLDGILYADRLDSHRRASLAKVVRKRGWGAPGHSWVPGQDDLEP